QEFGQFFYGMRIKTNAGNGCFPDHIQNPGVWNDEAWQKSMGCFAALTVHSADRRRTEQIGRFAWIRTPVLVEYLAKWAETGPEISSVFI
ncbi:MAG: hypothetical protein SCK29_00835, partial [Bacillota bacterium]|nr:hypothetical protein [Bacillota bacterium]